LDDLLPKDDIASFGLIARDDAPVAIPSFDELPPTSATRGSFEVFANCPVATLLPSIVARFS
jgi:hypothetical protein